MRPLLFWLWMAASLPALMHAANSINECRDLDHHGQLTQAESCFTVLSQSPDALVRAEAQFGLHRYSEANESFRDVVKSQPKSAVARVEWGNVYLAHYQAGDAAKLFEEALEIDPQNAAAYFGLARVASEGYDKKAVEFAHKALQLNPKLVEAQELLAYLALEDSNQKAAADEAGKALAISREALDAMAVLASIDWLNGKSDSPWPGRILKSNPAYGEAYDTGAHFLEINHQYQEAIALDRKALELNPNLWAARSHLGINLMRLGNDEEAKRELERCYDAHESSPQTRNALKFLDTLATYETFRTSTTELVLNRKESTLLRPYLEPELQRIIGTYERKYKLILPGPVRLEVYPNHQDFVVRVLGLPGQGGLLGVTFGLVVAMDSPSSRPPGELNWASTMWHELSHVYILTATHNLVPRWFTEGLAVHEESAASPDWGDRMTPDIVEALKNKKLLPVEELDRGFVRPEYPGQVIVSYFEAGKICDFIAGKWGNDAILGMVRSYGARKTTEEAITENLHLSASGFDKEFFSWLDGQTGNTVRHFDDWRNGLKSAYSSLKEGKNDEAIRQALAVRDFYPDYIAANSDYELLATCYLNQSKKPEAIAHLERYRDTGGTDVELLKKLARLELETGKTPAAMTTLKKVTFIYPEDEEVHRRYGAALLDSGDAIGAVREYRAALELKPTDTAESHYELAKALNAAHRRDEAKDQVVLALEAAPAFKPAQQLLLQLSQ